MDQQDGCDSSVVQICLAFCFSRSSIQFSLGRHCLLIIAAPHPGRSIWQLFDVKGTYPKRKADWPGTKDVGRDRSRLADGPAFLPRQSRSWDVSIGSLTRRLTSAILRLECIDPASEKRKAESLAGLSRSVDPSQTPRGVSATECLPLREDHPSTLEDGNANLARRKSPSSNFYVCIDQSTMSVLHLGRFEKKVTYLLGYLFKRKRKKPPR